MVTAPRAAQQSYPSRSRIPLEGFAGSIYGKKGVEMEDVFTTVGWRLGFGDSSRIRVGGLGFGV